MDLAPHSEFGSYRLLEKLGEGGMGVVWRALDTRLDREVALKVLPPGAALVPGRLQRFEREARLVAALNHPNIVTLFSVESVQGVHFITMELVRGRTLSELIPAAGLKTEPFFDLAVPLADALRAAHEHGIVHRDLKPANLMVDGEGRLKVLDFGLAKLWAQDDVPTMELTEAPTATAVTQVGRVIGTLPYMSPEQVQGRGVDHRTDIFSAGIVLYEMATGGRPFGGATPAELVSAILRDTPPGASEVNRTLPATVGRIVARCLEKDASLRYPSAAELRDELKAAQAQPRPRALAPFAVAAAAAAVLVALVALGVAFRPGAQGEAQPYTVAILPFANLTGDPAKNYMAEGISAALTTQLGELSAIRVLARTGGLSESADGATLRAAARNQGVDALLEGELQQAADRVRVDAKLTSTESGLVMLAEVFDGDVQDLFLLQKEIGHRFVMVLSIPISPNELRRLTRAPTKSFEAYDYFLRGHQLLQGDADLQSLESTIELLKQALRSDPGFALAHVDLSEALWRSWIYGSGEQRLAEAGREARRALEIDPGLPAAIVANARILRATGRQENSIVELQRALPSHPRPAQAQLELAGSYRSVGDFAEALKCYRAAVTFGGNDWFYHNELGAFLQELGRYDDAREAYERARDLAPPVVHVPHENLASLLVYEGHYEEAVVAFERLPGPIHDAILASNVATAYFFSDRPDRLQEAAEFYRLAVRLNPHNYEIRRNLADVYEELGRADLAREHFLEALRLIEDKLWDTPNDPWLLLRKAHYAARAQECLTAVPLARRLSLTIPATAENIHDLAFPFALCGEEREALEKVRTAIELGFSADLIRKEPEFRELVGNPVFDRLTGPGPLQE